MTKTAGPRPWLDWLLILSQLFLGINAAAAGAAFMIAPDGHLIGMPLSNLKESPFTDFLIPGILLFTFVGVFPLAVAYGLWRRPDWHWPDIINPFKGSHWSWAGSLGASVILIIWITVQVLLLQSVSLLHYLCWGWGLFLLVLTVLPTVQRYYVRKPR
jgi:hypothetical protein